MSLVFNILFIFLLIALNAFFVSIEFAIISVRKARIQVLAEEGNSIARVVEGWLEHHTVRDRLIAASQIGVTMVSLALGIVGERTFQVLLDPFISHFIFPLALDFVHPALLILPFLLTLVIITSLHVIFGEQVPKVVTLYAPEKVVLSLARPMQVFVAIFNWFIVLLDWITRKVLSIFGLKVVSGHSLTFTVDEFRQKLDESEQTGIIEAPEREMLDAIFDINELLVRHITTPRMEIIAIEADTPLNEIVSMTANYPYTKFPVFEENLDQILGILHVKELLPKVQDPNCLQCTARELTREALFVPESISVMALLREFRAKHHHMAIVIDEFGGTAGLVTLEDLLQEIIGEVSGPFDPGSLPEIQPMPDGSYQIDGMLLLEEVNKELDLDLKEENYDTIAGYILGKLGRIPVIHDTVIGDGVRLEVLAMDGMRIERVGLKKINAEEHHIIDDLPHQTHSSLSQDQ
jgi:CBS domain containing-hemolysin-like protein